MKKDDIKKNEEINENEDIKEARKLSDEELDQVSAAAVTTVTGLAGQHTSSQMYCVGKHPW